MCFKKKQTKEEPVRLEKKSDVDYKICLAYLVRKPEFWLIVGVIVALIFMIALAFMESISYMVYNNGINSTVGGATCLNIL